MATEYTFEFPLPNGLHARPASYLQAVASRFSSDIVLHDESTGKSGNAKSVLALVACGVRGGDRCRLIITGADEGPALSALERFVVDRLPHVDEVTKPAAPDAAALRLPHLLQTAGLECFARATPVSPGIGIGRAILHEAIRWHAPAEASSGDRVDPAVERARFESAVVAVKTALDQKIASARHAQERDVVASQRSIAEDVLLADRVTRAIDQDHQTAIDAVIAAMDEFAAAFRESGTAYLRERALDLADVRDQLLLALGAVSRSANPSLTEPSVYIADELTPTQFLALDRHWLRALVLRDAGMTSHTVILARAIGVPTVVNVSDPSGIISAGATLVVDAGLGLIIADPSEPVRRYYALEQQKLTQLQARSARDRHLPAVTRDGHRLEVGVNIASAEEVEPAMNAGADGIGLFRTEMFFMDAAAAPSEEEQFRIYAQAARDAGGKPVIIRLIDIGGDKPAAYLNLPSEPNPFLGVRGVRLYGQLESLVRTQLRAIFRAAPAGELRLLVPMISNVDEIRRVRRWMTEVAAELSAAGAEVRVPALGVMIEVPAAAFAMDALCNEVDFFSVGSNDLAQYFFAADRGNAQVADLYTWAQPPFLRLLGQIVEQAHTHGKWVGLCGELGDEPLALPLLLAMGFDEISVSGVKAPAIKAAVRAMERERCQELLGRAVRAADRFELRTLLDSFAPPMPSLPVVSADLILVDAPATSKAEAIKLLVDQLAIAGRTQHPQEIEDAVWAREETYSTGFGYGFAVPHCKTDHLSDGSIALAKLAEPVAWGSIDGAPVDIVILLAIPAKDHAKSHLELFARLSRLVMRDEFRNALRAENDRHRLLELLESHLGLRQTPVSSG